MMQDVYISGGTVAAAKETFDTLFWSVGDVTKASDGANIEFVYGATEQWVNDEGNGTAVRAQKQQKTVAFMAGTARGIGYVTGKLVSTQQLMQQNVKDDYGQQMLNVLEQARALRERIAAYSDQTDSVSTLEEIREDRMDELSGLH